ncbi:MAG: hypothetical protein H6Q90_3497 [Deltaproteobacteria bacterium]|nr:hypothetical protein [Deltaproteobacteria bacterium]
MRRFLVVGLVGLVGLIGLVGPGCQGKPNEPGGAGSDRPEPVRDAAPGLGANPEREDALATIEADAGPRPDEPEPADPGKLVAELGAIPAWQAVVDRAQLLARRGQHGVVYGRIGPALMVAGPTPEPTDAGLIDAGMIASPYVWLVDDTESNGALGIRVELGHGRDLKEADRVALGGAWAVDAERHWFWKVDTVQVIPPPPPTDLHDPSPPVPSHAVGNGGLPAGVRPIALAKDGDAVYFTVVGAPPASEGDGWPVGNELGDPVFALLTLPGERSSYGGQDMRAPDERWQLKRGQTYWVRIGKIRLRADKPALIHARTAPVRVM